MMKFLAVFITAAIIRKQYAVNDDVHATTGPDWNGINCCTLSIQSL